MALMSLRSELFFKKFPLNSEMLSDSDDQQQQQLTSKLVSRKKVRCKHSCILDYESAAAIKQVFCLLVYLDRSRWFYDTWLSFVQSVSLPISSEQTSRLHKAFGISSSQWQCNQTPFMWCDFILYSWHSSTIVRVFTKINDNSRM